MKLTIKAIKEKLNEVLDPEIGISIVDLGLIYGVEISELEKVTITMTLTTPGCPLIGLIEEDIRLKIQQLGIKKNNIEIKVTFDPPWSMDKMTKKGKKQLGF